jgi:hypothetical protein
MVRLGCDKADHFSPCFPNKKLSLLFFCQSVVVFVFCFNGFRISFLSYVLLGKDAK